MTNEKSIESYNLKFNEDKYKKIRYYPDESFDDFFQMLDSKSGHFLLKKSMKKFVPLQYIKSKNDREKYGAETINAFKTALRGRADEKLNMHAKTVFPNLYTGWLMLLPGVNEYLTAEDTPDTDYPSTEFIKSIIEGCKKHKIPKEIVQLIYNFYPFQAPNRTLAAQIQELEYTMDDYQADEEQGKKAELEEEFISDSGDELEMLDKQNRELLEKNAELEEENEHLRAQIEAQNNIPTSNVNVEKMKQNLLDRITVLEENNQNLEKEVEDLLRENEELKENSSDSYEVIELKDKLRELENKYANLDKIKVPQITKEIFSNKNTQRAMMQLLLSNTRAVRILRERLDFSTEIQEYLEVLNDKLYRLKEMELEPVKPCQYSYNPRGTFDRLGYLRSLRERFKAVSGYSISDLGHRFSNDKFFILEDEKHLEAFGFEENDIEVNRVSVELDWHGIEDWYGYFKDGEFIPAKTNVSEYYQFVFKESELPFGAVVFYNFNKIPPDIYLHSFIETIGRDEPYNLVEPSAVNNSPLSQIHSLHNLKYIFIMSKDSNSFDIPESMRKYILNGDREES